MNSSTLKKFQTLLKKLKAKKDVIKNELIDCQERYNKVTSEISDTQTKINELTKNNNLIVSEHATIRILERMCNIELGKLNQKIIDELLPTYKILGDGIYPISILGLRAVVKNGIIVTVK